MRRTQPWTPNKRTTYSIRLNENIRRSVVWLGTNTWHWVYHDHPFANQRLDVCERIMSGWENQRLSDMNNLDRSCGHKCMCERRSFSWLGRIFRTGSTLTADFPYIENNIGCNSILYNGNILGANQYLRVNHGNFNLGYRINIQGKGRRGVGGGICKSVITQSKSGRLIKKITQSPYALLCYILKHC